MLSLNVRTPVHENNHTSHRVQDPSLIRISQHSRRLIILRSNNSQRSLVETDLLATILLLPSIKSDATDVV